MTVSLVIISITCQRSVTSASVALVKKKASKTMSDYRPTHAEIELEKHIREMGFEAQAVADKVRSKGDQYQYPAEEFAQLFDLLAEKILAPLRKPSNQ